MPEQILNQFRSDKQLRQDCIEIYETMGLNLNTAFRMFMKRTRIVKISPFPATLNDEEIRRIKVSAVLTALREETAEFPEMS